MKPILEAENITKYFGGLAALSNVSFSINQGELVGFIGPNGAGKTTLINVITGAKRPTSGEIRFKGIDIKRMKNYEISRMGIARTFQIVKPFPGMTVKENVLTAALFGSNSGKLTVKEALERSEKILDMVGLSHRMNASPNETTIPDRKRLELAKALATEPELLLLDEVMAGLNPTELNKIMELIRDINRKGRTILIIEHVMKAIMGLSQRIIVLHHGKKISEGSPAQIANDDSVIEAYLGEKYAKAKRGEK